jgi:hypothetical protein
MPSVPYAVQLEVNRELDAGLQAVNMDRIGLLNV